MRALNALEFPLNGQQLIEASAGTGKTYTIANLYLRVLLGDGCEALSVEQILLVTFTNAATAELRARIRQRVNDAYLAFAAQQSDDEFLQALINGCADLELAQRRLYLAIHLMDEAAIYTIHSICQRLLTEHAFATDSMFGLSLLLDESEYVDLAVGDFWRQHVVEMSALQLGVITTRWKSPSQLARAIKDYLYRPVTVRANAEFESKQALADVESRMLAQVASAKKQWIDGDYASLLQEAGLRANVKVGKASSWQIMDEFCRSSQLVPPKGHHWFAYSNNAIKKALKKGVEPTLALNFEGFELATKLFSEWQDGLVYYVYQSAITHVQQRLQREKNRLLLQSTDDLLCSLQRALIENPSLAKVLQNQYPLAMIDEFQDTDPVQFEIFSRIYRAAGSLIMIGDPKQAIYSFRGADIFTYLLARRGIAEHHQYTLARNWRSRACVVDVCNQLFSLRDKSFIEDQIPFQPVDAAAATSWQAPDDKDSSMNLIYLAGEPKSVEEAQQQLASDFANQIADWLNNADQVSIKSRPLNAGDCCVLVHDRHEASVIRNALRQRGVNSVFLSRDSVFQSDLAYPMWLLLRALNEPHKDSYIRAAMSSRLFSKTHGELDSLFSDDALWQQVCDQYHQLHQVWRRHGLLSALTELDSVFDVCIGLVQQESGSRLLTDFRHLAELLQEQSTLLHGPMQLLRYLEHRLSQADDNNETQQLRLESDDNLVQIVTMHRSKGLQYPLVFIPFACKIPRPVDPVYHSDDATLIIDLSMDEKSVEQAQTEQLAEQIRLLYVAMTRAEYHLSIGVWNPKKGTSKQGLIHTTALGYLLQLEANASEQQIVQALNLWQARCTEKWMISYSPLEQTDWQVEQAAAPTLSVKSLQKPVRQNWLMTSYSALARPEHHSADERPGRDEGQSVQAENDEPTQEDRFAFPRGASAGSFLHDVLEHCELRAGDALVQAVEKFALRYAIEPTWLPVATQWLDEVLSTPLSTQENLQLSHLKQGEFVAEMEFYLPLKRVQGAVFNQTLAKHCSIPMPEYHFDELSGMLKGFIDLTYCHQGRYVVLDYKSNYLGAKWDDYNAQACKNAMKEHDYYLQAILYSVALHRWLKVSVADYQFSEHHGGAQYAFLRGMHPDFPGHGVYVVSPSQALIEALDDVFDGGTAGVE